MGGQDQAELKDDSARQSDIFITAIFMNENNPLYYNPLDYFLLQGASLCKDFLTFEMKENMETSCSISFRQKFKQ